jgi:hypothetical protein
MALQHLRSSTANKRPDPTAMAEGQLALNTANASPGLFYKDATGSLIKSGPVHIGATAPNATPAAGGHAGNSVGEAWLDTSGTNPLLKIYNGAAFVTVQPVASGTVVSTADTGTVTSTMILDGTILNADINASAAIVDTKLATIATGGKVSGTAITSGNISTSGSFTSTSTVTGTNLIPTGSGVPTNGIYLPAANSVAVATNGTGRLFVNASGRVGVGTASPGYTLDVAGTCRIGAADTSTALLEVGVGATGDRIALIDLVGDTTYSDFGLRVIRSGGANANSEIRHRGTGKLIMQSYESGVVSFDTAAIERARIDSSGRLLVGTSSARTVGSAGVLSQIESTGGEAGLSIVRNSNGNTGGGLTLAKSRGTSNGSSTIVQSGDDLGLVQFAGADGNDLASIAARITAQVDGTPGANSMPGRIVLSTTANGASSPTERMRIGRNGAVLIGVADGIGTLSVGTDNTNPVVNNVGGICIRNQGHILSNTQATGAISAFRRDGDGSLITFHNSSSTAIGSISVAGSTTAYNTSSDYRLKENIVDLTGAADRVNQLQVHRFNFIANPEATVDGFLAHEVQAIVPEAITGEKDAVDDDGNPEYQGIDQSKLVPLLTAALQEAIGEIESLKARLTAAGI